MQIRNFVKKRNDSLFLNGIFVAFVNLPSILMPLFSILISGGGDFLAEGSFLGTSKCEGMLLLLWLVGRLAWANSCFTTTGGNTVLLVITFFDVEGIVDGVLPRKVMQNQLKNDAQKFRKLLHSGKLTKQAAAVVTPSLLRGRIPFLSCKNSFLTPM